MNDSTWDATYGASTSDDCFICVLFTYIGVNTFLPGIHSYA